MSARIGIDLVDVDSVRNSISAHGKRYLDRVYTPGELAASRAGEAAFPHLLAGCWAAKEAVMKVLQVGDAAVGWRQIEVRQPLGQAHISLHGDALLLAQRAGIRGLSLSLSAGRESAVAIVIAELQTECRCLS